ncbi:hypothetical protein V3C99_009577 [Haemonchus contortus]
MNLFVILSVVASLATIPVDAGTSGALRGHSSDSSQQTSGLPLTKQPFPEGAAFSQDSQNDNHSEDPVNLIQESQEATLSVDSGNLRLDDEKDILSGEQVDRVETVTGSHILELKEELRPKDIEDHTPKNERVIRSEIINDHFQRDREDTRSEDLEVIHVSDIEDFLREDPMDGFEW